MPLLAQDGWQEALRAMPLSAERPLNRDNCLPILLRAFQSNVVVKGLIVLPGVSDDFYLINRDRPKLNLQAGNLLDAITALTNVTAVRVTFKPPFVLLHLERERLEPTLIVKNKAAAERLRQQHDMPHALWIDAHWTRLQPFLGEAMRTKIRPAGPSEDAWHFARHNLAGWDLTDWDLLAGLSLAGKTSISVYKGRVLFRLRDVPKISRWW